jgi:rfaE bifunctional protein nucleotidyltransferase chain/domain/rfaE bifunctional protein kinase chain/domain
VSAQPGVRSLLERFPGTRLVVVGDAVLDRWTHGSARRLGREAPVAVLDVTAEESSAGAAGNAAANVAALGGQVSFVSRVGADPAGEDLRGALRRRGVHDELVVSEVGVQTPSKERLVCDGHLLARADRGRASSPSPGVARQLAEALERATRDAHGVLVCDYGCGMLSSQLVDVLHRIRRTRDVPFVVDAHDLRPWAACAPTAVLPSWSEAIRLLVVDSLDMGTTRAALAEERGPDLLDRSGAAMVVVTLDGDGAMLHRRGHRPHRTYATRVPITQTTGAGDTLAAAFTLSLSAGADPAQALDVAQAAASVVVRSTGTTTCTKHDLVRQLVCDDGPFQTAEQLARHIDGERARDRRIVFTNGCFDVLHRGHVSYLQQARTLGDVLVVAVNSDGSVSRLKGPGRPVNPVEDRVAVLAALSCVDYVTVFEEDTPERLLELIRPDLYVKGGDYTPAMLPETPIVERLGGRVRILDYVEDRSTTALLDRIRGGATTT